MMTFDAAHRVSITCTATCPVLSHKSILWGDPVFGCVLGFYPTKKKRQYVCIGLDDPLNIEPTTLENEACSSYLVDGDNRHLIMIDCSEIGISIFVERRPSASVDCTDDFDKMVLCRDRDCLKGNKRSHTIKFCENRTHFICKKHLFPVDSEGLPKLTAMAEFKREIENYVTTHGLNTLHVDTRTCISWRNWKLHPHDRVEILKNIVGADYWMCPTCSDSNRSAETSFSFLELEHQIFPNLALIERADSTASVGRHQFAIKTHLGTFLSPNENMSTISTTQYPSAMDMLEKICEDPIGRSDSYFCMKTMYGSYIRIYKTTGGQIGLTQTTEIAQSMLVQTVEEQQLPGGAFTIGYKIESTGCYLCATVDGGFTQSSNLLSPSCYFQELFLSEQDLLGGPIVQSMELRKSAMFDQLVSRGYTKNEVHSLLASIPDNQFLESDEDHVDEDYLVTLLASARTAEAAATGGEQDCPRVTTDVVITGFMPELGFCTKLGVERGYSYHDLVAALTAQLEIPYPQSDISFTVIEADGWSLELSQSDYADSDDTISVCSLQDGDIIEARHLLGAVGGKYRLTAIAGADRYNASLVSKAAVLSQSYRGYRKIRGDGDCYYRTVLFGLIEQLIFKKEQASLLHVHSCFSGVHFAERDPAEDVHRLFLSKLRAAAEGKIWTDVAEFEAEVLREETELDVAMVRASKSLVASLLVGRKDDILNGISLQEAILPAHDDVKTIEEFCDEYVLKMHVCAEGAHVDLGLLPRALGCASSIVLLSREAHVQLATLRTEVEPGMKQIGDVHLLFRPGHYDLLYALKEGGGVKSVERPNVADAPADIRQGSGKSSGSGEDASTYTASLGSLTQGGIKSASGDSFEEPANNNSSPREKKKSSSIFSRSLKHIKKFVGVRGTVSSSSAGSAAGTGTSEPSTGGSGEASTTTVDQTNLQTKMQRPTSSSISSSSSSSLRSGIGKRLFGRSPSKSNGDCEEQQAMTTKADVGGGSDDADEQSSKSHSVNGSDLQQSPSQPHSQSHSQSQSQSQSHPQSRSESLTAFPPVRGAAAMPGSVTAQNRGPVQQAIKSPDDDDDDTSLEAAMAMEIQLVSMLSIPRSVAQRLARSCSSFDAAVEYYFSNPGLFEPSSSPGVILGDSDGVEYIDEKKKINFAENFYVDTFTDSEIMPKMGGGRNEKETYESGTSDAHNELGGCKMLDMEELYVVQQQHPEFNNKEIILLLSRVVGLGFSQTKATLAVRMSGCRNLFSVCKVIRCEACGLVKHICTLEEKVPDAERDINLYQLVLAMVGMGYNRDNVVDAVVFDYCVEIEDVIDAVQALSAASSSSSSTTPDSAAAPPSSFQSSSSSSLQQKSAKGKLVIDVEFQPNRQSSSRPAARLPNVSPTLPSSSFSSSASTSSAWIRRAAPSPRTDQAIQMSVARLASAEKLEFQDLQRLRQQINVMNRDQLVSALTVCRRYRHQKDAQSSSRELRERLQGIVEQKSTLTF